MYTVRILGHSLLRPYLPGGTHYEPSHKHIQLTYHCCPGATYKSILNSQAYADLINLSSDLIIIVLGGNDLVYDADIKEVYQNLVNLISKIKKNCSPQFGLHILEPEIRLGNPSFIDSRGYASLRNSLVRKIKKKKQLSILPLIKFSLNTNQLSPDGVHLNTFGRSLLQTILKSHISDILFDGDLASTEL